MAGEMPEMLLSNENLQLSLNVFLTNGRRHAGNILSNENSQLAVDTFLTNGRRHAGNILSNDNSLLLLNLFLTNAGQHAEEDSVFCLKKTCSDAYF